MIDRNRYNDERWHDEETHGQEQLIAKEPANRCRWLKDVLFLLVIAGLTALIVILVPMLRNKSKETASSPISEASGELGIEDGGAVAVPSSPVAPASPSAPAASPSAGMNEKFDPASPVAFIQQGVAPAFPSSPIAPVAMRPAGSPIQDFQGGGELAFPSSPIAPASPSMLVAPAIATRPAGSPNTGMNEMLDPASAPAAFIQQGGAPAVPSSPIAPNVNMEPAGSPIARKPDESGTAEMQPTFMPVAFIQDGSTPATPSSPTVAVDIASTVSSPAAEESGTPSPVTLEGLVAIAEQDVAISEQEASDKFSPVATETSSPVTVDVFPTSAPIIEEDAT